MLTCIVVDLVAKISWIELLKKKKKQGLMPWQRVGFARGKKEKPRKNQV